MAMTLLVLLSFLKYVSKVIRLAIWNIAVKERTRSCKPKYSGHNIKLELLVIGNNSVDPELFQEKYLI